MTKGGSSDPFGATNRKKSEEEEEEEWRHHASIRPVLEAEKSKMVAYWRQAGLRFVNLGKM